jgi:uncharacterized protein YceK
LAGNTEGICNSGIENIGKTIRMRGEDLKRIVVGLMVLCLLILSGCSHGENVYSGIDSKDIPQVAKSKEVYSFQGHSDNWAVSVFIYKLPGTERYDSVSFLKFLEPKPYPTGEIRTNYDGGSGFVGSSGAIISEDVSVSGIYFLLLPVAKAVPDKDTVIKLQVIWDGQSDYFELKA